MNRRLCFKLSFMILFVAAFMVTTGYGSKIKKLELSELPKSAQAIVLGEVIGVTQKALDLRTPVPYDEVTVKVASVIKGKLKVKKINIVLQPRGVKDFDPALKVGDMGVFFLHEIKESQAKLAYWGSVAVFSKPNFVVSDKPKKATKMSTTSTKIKIETSLGDIVIELNEEKAPITVKNFLSYVEDSYYDGLIFHRVISGFMIQGGGFTEDMQKKKTKPPITNEASNGLKNERGTIAMARTNDPDSATSQFFINHKNNDFLNYAGSRNPGYTVFGKVTEGMEIVDKIAAVKTTTRNGMPDVPVKPVIIKSAKVVAGR